MAGIFKALDSSIGKKILMSVTGLGLYLFLLSHLAGNLLMYAGDKGKAFNAYADALASTNLLIVAELGLLVILIVHVITAVRLSFGNRQARNEKYVYKRLSIGNRTLMSSNMMHTGGIVLIFLVIHLVTFKFGDWSNIPGSGKNTLFEHVVFKFQNIYYAGGYSIAMILLGMHLHHAFQSAFQTLGLNHKTYTPLIQKTGVFLSILIALGYMSFPIYFYLIH